MKNNRTYISNLLENSWLGILAVLLFWTTSCSKMDDTYRDFWKDGEIIYPAIANSIQVYPGKNRIKLSWLIKGDASVTRAKIYWNAQRDSLEIPIQSTGQVDTVNVILNDLAEGFYVFDIFTFDNDNHKSLKASATGTVYGNNYGQYLLNRVIEKALFKDDVLSVVWRPIGDETSIGSELKYSDAAGNDFWILVDPQTDTTLIDNYDFHLNSGQVVSRTMYVPPLSIDTFYTALDTTRVIGPPILISQTGWIATASRSRAGGEPEKAIDGDIGTVWWTSDGGSFPYSFSVDMGEVKGPLNGIYLQTNRVNPQIQTFELLVSNDSVEWKMLGVFNVEDNNDRQYFEFINQEQFRYFQIDCTATYRNKANCAISEVGVYYR